MRAFLGNGVLVAAVIGATGVFAPAAASGAGAGVSKPTDELITLQQAVGLGFTKLVHTAQLSESTGLPDCTSVVQEAFEDGTGGTGLVSEAYFCNSTKAARTLMQGIAATGSALAQVIPPRSLGPSATARKSSSSSFGIFWLRGSVVEVAAMDTGLGSATSTTAGSGAAPVSGALSAHLRRVLVTTAAEQNARFVAPPANPTAAAQAAADRVAAASGCPSKPGAALHKPTWAGPPPGEINTTKTYTATVTTDVGTFVIALDASTVAETVNNFVFLAQHRFFDCVTFHRVIPGFVDQTGDPTGTGTGGPGYTIVDQLPPKAADPAQQYPLGSVAMANTGQPNSGGSQWFVVAGSQGESLPNSYTLFGHVTTGMSVVEAINADGSSSGTPPNVIHRILKVTTSSS